MEDIFNTGITWAAFSTFLFVLLKAALILVVGFAAVKLTYKFVDMFVSKRNAKKDDEVKKKAVTLSNIIKSALKWFIYFIIAMSVLNEFGLGTAASSILATAGIGGLAISFGAQNLVKDMVTGGFMIYEDQYKIGDYVKVAGVEGFVEHVSLRVTKIRSFSGEVYIVPNGQITIVTNLSRGDFNAAIEVGVSYNTPLDKAIESMKKAGKAFAESVDYVKAEPNVLGVTELADYYVALKMVCLVKPMYQFEAERTLLKMVKEQFDKDGIDIPFPTYQLKGDKKEENNG